MNFMNSWSVAKTVFLHLAKSETFVFEVCVWYSVIVMIVQTVTVMSGLV